MITETISTEAQRQKMDIAAEKKSHDHPPTPAGTWAEESPSYRAPVESYRAPVEYTAEAEDDFWKANHQSQSYAGESSYGYFAPAYRTGYEGYARYSEGHTFEEAEPLLQEEYEHAGGKLDWSAVRSGAEAAWIRLEQRRLISAPLKPRNL